MKPSPKTAAKLRPFSSVTSIVLDNLIEEGRSVQRLDKTPGRERAVWDGGQAGPWRATGVSEKNFALKRLRVPAYKIAIDKPGLAWHI